MAVQSDGGIYIFQTTTGHLWYRQPKALVDMGGLEAPSSPQSDEFGSLIPQGALEAQLTSITVQNQQERAQKATAPFQPPESPRQHSK
jgi:hypothetical protein